MHRILVVLLAALLAVAGCGQVQDGSGNPGAAPGPTVDTMFGPVTVPARPQKVVALGWSDAEAALALGVQPIAASDWLAFGGEGVGPWAAGRYTAPPTIQGTLEINYEQLSALGPDLILNTRSDGSKEKYDELSKIAPTVGPPPGVISYGTSWQQQVQLVAQALGKPDEGKRLVDDLDGRFAAARSANPEFAGKTVAVGAFYSDKYAAYVDGDTRVEFMESLGFRNKPEIQALAKGGSFSVDLAREQTELLDADLTVVFPIGADPAVLRADRVLNQLPSAKAGHLVIMDDATLSNAFSSGSTLGLGYALEKATPLFGGGAP